MTPKIVPFLLIFVLASACAHTENPGSSTNTPADSTPPGSTTAADEPNPPSPEHAHPVVGGGPDEHGCVHDGGYRWCEREHACVRSWELAQERGFDRSAEAFDRYCAGP